MNFDVFKFQHLLINIWSGLSSHAFKVICKLAFCDSRCMRMSLRFFEYLSIDMICVGLCKGANICPFDILQYMGYVPFGDGIYP